MVLYFYAYLLALLAAIGFAGYVGVKVIKRLKSRGLSARQIQGQRNALALHTSLAETCSFCGKPTSPTSDAFEASIGWYHPDCYKQLVE